MTLTVCADWQDCEPSSSDSCAYANNGYCGDGGPGSEFSSCDLDTDCTDCGSIAGRGCHQAGICDFEGCVTVGVSLRLFSLFRLASISFTICVGSQMLSGREAREFKIDRDSGFKWIDSFRYHGLTYISGCWVYGRHNRRCRRQKTLTEDASERFQSYGLPSALSSLAMKYETYGARTCRLCRWRTYLRFGVANAIIPNGQIESFTLQETWVTAQIQVQLPLLRGSLSLTVYKYPGEPKATVSVKVQENYQLSAPISGEIDVGLQSRSSWIPSKGQHYRMQLEGDVSMCVGACFPVAGGKIYPWLS